jgi:hypothetical protein
MSESRSNLILWVCFALACLFLYPFNEKVVCETRLESRAIQLVSYTKVQFGIPIPVPWGTRHDWLEQRLGVRFVDGWQSRWLLHGASAASIHSLQHAACFSAVVTNNSFIYFPIKTPSGDQLATFQNAAFAVVPAMPQKFERAWDEGFISGGFPLFYYSTVRPLGRDMKVELLEPSEKMRTPLQFEWVTTSFDGVGSKQLLATQFGRISWGIYYTSFAYEAYQMGGHPVSAPGERDTEKRVSIKRRLRSLDGGQSWELHDWEVLRPELHPKGVTISPVCPC